jgi:MYXO-CTERM domain-containing protein
MHFPIESPFMYTSGRLGTTPSRPGRWEAAVFVRSTRIDLVLSVLFVLAMGACGNLGGCGACGASQPLPPGGLPATQTVEGGAQIRVTPTGFNKLESLLPAALNQAINGGFCVGQGQAGTPSGGFLATGVKWCYSQQGTCNPGCKANIALNNGGMQLDVTNQQTLHLHLSTSVSATVPIKGQVVGIGFSCSLTGTSNNLAADADIAFGINATTGELEIHLANVNQLQLNMNFSGCSVVSDILDLLGGLIDSFAGQFIIQLLTPVLDNLLQGMIPNPLGIAGMLDVGGLLGGVSPGTTGEMEARIVPGGYVSLLGGGMSLGVITGVNSDLDPSTRTGMRADNVPFASEPSLCVPPLGTPDFANVPFSLPTTSRGTFKLDPADEFAGSPDPSGPPNGPAPDLAMGLSHTTLDQLGHHLVTSGGMCLGVGTSYISQLNVGTIGILVPSLADLDDSGKAPLLLVTRPQREITFNIGDNTANSPALTIGLSHMEVDFYAFLYERYVRAFTIDLTMDIGVNLQFQQLPGQPAQILPSLVGISSHDVTLKVLNSDFVKETPAHLESVLPSVFDLVTPLLGNLPPINVPNFAGFSLENLSITRVTTSQDEFLAIYASLGATAMMRTLGNVDPYGKVAVDRLDRDMPPPLPRSTGGAHLVNVVTPQPEVVRDGLARAKTGALPTITFDTDRYDAGGRELEWTWSFNGGMWHEWRPGGTFEISDRAFAWQGHYAIGMKSRVKGNYHTVSETQTTLVTIDSVGPKVITKQAHWTDSDLYVMPVVDIVDGQNVEIAYGRPGDEQPTTAWIPYAADIGLSRDQANKLGRDGLVAVYAKDQTGNKTIELVAPFHGQAGGASGCGCGAGGPGAGGVAAIAIVGFVVLRRRDRRWMRRFLRSRAFSSCLLFVGASVLTSMTPGCDCKNNGRSCETADDCGPDFCPKGQLPFCIDNTCVCSDDIPAGRIGPYQSVAASPDQSIWVAAYAQTYGDLVVAQTQGGRIPTETWQWVDGVPVDANVDVPGSMIRGGISANGPDVGMYTSIQVLPDATPIVTYFDVDNASLKFAFLTGGVWTTYTVDAGATGSKKVGMYTSMVLRSDDGRPGVSYLAHVTDAAGEHAEVRFAEAKVALPQSAADWSFYTIDTAAIPPADPANPDVYPLPEGLGLWIAAARDPRDQTPVVVYYDRAAGQLKLARFNTSMSKFGTPVILDGSPGNDAGWTPSVRVDPQGVAHVAYINAQTDSLMYTSDASGAMPSVIDNGYRIVGQTVDGLPKPEFHILDNADLVLPPGNPPMVVYQDGTTSELLLGQQQMNGTWNHISVAGATQPWPGAYGFFASAAVRPSDVVISTWVIDQPADDNWVEVFTKPTLIQ